MSATFADPPGSIPVTRNEITPYGRLHPAGWLPAAGSSTTRSCSSSPSSAYTTNSAAALASVQADPESARTRAALALDLAQDDVTWLAGHAVGAKAAAALGDAGLCTRYLERLEPWAGLGIWQGTCSYGPVDTAIAALYRTLGDDSASARHAERAHEVAQSLGAVPYLHELDALITE